MYKSEIEISQIDSKNVFNCAEIYVLHKASLHTPT